MHVLCPGCGRQVFVGELPPGALPSCPACQTVFQLPGGGGAGIPAHAGPAHTELPGVGDVDHPHHAAAVDAPREDVRFEERMRYRRRSSPWSALGWGAAMIVVFLGLVVAVVYLTVLAFRGEPKPKKAPPPKNRSAMTASTAIDTQRITPLSKTIVALTTMNSR